MPEGSMPCDVLSSSLHIMPHCTLHPVSALSPELNARAMLGGIASFVSVAASPCSMLSSCRSRHFDRGRHATPPTRVPRACILTLPRTRSKVLSRPRCPGPRATSRCLFEFGFVQYCLTRITWVGRLHVGLLILERFEILPDVQFEKGSTALPASDCKWVSSCDSRSSGANHVRRRPSARSLSGREPDTRPGDCASIDRARRCAASRAKSTSTEPCAARVSSAAARRVLCCPQLVIKNLVCVRAYLGLGPPIAPP
ncbi:hypothetical protein C8Q77DRAFT_701118 [Trametes polyzona]|nr:hypothetical protein C8Q77DRAFT_701118 [Trametes polyzona]